MENQVAEVSSKFFCYDAVSRTFMSDMSTLEANGYGNGRLFNRIFNDACDVGFEIVSSKTNQKVLMTFTNCVKTDENEIVSWHFEGSIFNGITHKTIIFND